MCVIIQLYYSKSMKVESNQINFVFFIHNRKNCNKSIVQSISFYNELSIRDPVHKDESRDKCLLEKVEIITTERIKLPGNILLGKVC